MNKASRKSGVYRKNYNHSNKIYENNNTQPITQSKTIKSKKHTTRKKNKHNIFH
jgi:hypothetical protein